MCEITLSQEEIDAGYVVTWLGGSDSIESAIACSPEVNKMLFEVDSDTGCNSVQASLVKQSYRPRSLGEELWNIADKALDAYLDGHEVFNSWLIGQASLLLPDMEEVVLRETDYFSYLMSDGLSHIMGVQLGQALERGLMPGFVGNRLLPLKLSRSSNVIGASTMAVTADGFLLLNQQGDKSVSNPGRLAPSGSGSVEMIDFRSLTGRGGSCSLTELVRTAAERELCEESGVAPAWIDGSRVIGFMRNIAWNGHPEYVCLTQLSVGSSDIASSWSKRQVAEEERGFSGRPKMVWVESNVGESITAYIAAHDDAPVSTQVLSASLFLRQLGI